MAQVCSLAYLQKRAAGEVEFEAVDDSTTSQETPSLCPRRAVHHDHESCKDRNETRIQRIGKWYGALYKA